MMNTNTVDSDDEFYGDQSSNESDAGSFGGNSCNNYTNDITKTAPSDPYGNVATHEYRSQERSIQTLSYVDGYDETKEEKLQEGFSIGYQQSFHDAFRIGKYLGSVCAKAAIDESMTLLLGTTTKSIDYEMQMSGHNSTTRSIERAATLVSKFLRDEILIGRNEPNDIKQQEAIRKLEDQLGDN